MNRRIYIHILFWVAYWLFESNIEFAWLSNSLSFASAPVFKRLILALSEEFVQLFLHIPYVYLLLYLLYQRTRPPKTPYGPAILIALLAIAAVILHRLLVTYFILPVVYGDSELEKPFPVNRVISSFLNLLTLSALAIIAKQYRMSLRWKEREKNLEKEKLEAELKFLRTQTNPHFLFNTLNNIYALARKKSDVTADVVMKLSKLLRFMLYESRREFITLAEELRVLDDYIELEKIRYNDRLKLRFTREVDNEQQKIAPLILLPFVENAFKHGASETRFESSIDIFVRLTGGQLSFMIRNSKEDNGQDEIVENIGLGNVRRQLELMYPQHQLTIDHSPEYFQVNLTINLQPHVSVPMYHSGR